MRCSVFGFVHPADPARALRRARHSAARAVTPIAFAIAGGCGGKVAGTPDAASPSASSPGHDASSPGALTITAAHVTRWRGGAEAAYSLIHDDFCAGAEGILAHAVPELRAHDLRCGLATVVGNCSSAGLVATLETLALDGFELVNHSYSHPHITLDVAQHEIVESKQLLESYSGRPVMFFAFPYDDRTDATVAFVAAAGYLGARAGPDTVNAPDFADPFHVAFDVYGAYSAYGTGLQSLDGFVDAAVARGGWAVRECHGVGDTSWEPVPIDVYRAHLDRVQGLVESRKLWMAPPSAVLRYRLARDACGTPTIAGQRVSLSGSTACRALSSPLTIALSVSGSHASLTAKCGASEIPSRKDGSSQWLIDVDPGATCELVAQ